MLIRFLVPKSNSNISKINLKKTQKTGLIDYEKLEQMALIYNPKIIIAGASAYARLYDYERLSLLCEEIGAYLLADTSHIMGMIASKSIPSPFDFCDLVMSTTHKTYEINMI